MAAYGRFGPKVATAGCISHPMEEENWEQIHSVSKHTGCADLIVDPKNPDILYASFHQRRARFHLHGWR